MKKYATIIALLFATACFGADAPKPATPPPIPAPTVAELKAKVDNLTKQLEDANKALQVVSQQRNQLAAQLLDVQVVMQVSAKKD